MSRSGIRIFFSVLSFLGAALCQATPLVVRIEGNLFDSSGLATGDSSRDMKLRAYASATGGSVLWTSAVLNARVSGTRFSLVVDASQGSPSLRDVVLARGSTESLWFEIETESSGPADGSLTSSVTIPLRFAARGDMYALSVGTVDHFLNMAVSTSAPNAGDVLKWNSTSSKWEPTASSLGRVSSVGLSMPSGVFSVAGSPVTTSGTLAGSLSNQSANTVLMGPTSGVDAAPAFRSLVSTDLPVMTYALGGLNTSLTGVSGAVLYASSTSAVALTLAGTSGQVLLSGATSAPTWGSIDITRGGTGASTRQAAWNALAPTGPQRGDLVYYDGTNWTRLARGSAGQVLATNGTTLGWVTYAGFQSGIIVMWSGAIGSIPSGWVLCDGTNGTPDLRNQFVVGAGSTYAVGNSGGSLASHNHTASSTFTGTASTHTHTASSSFSSSFNSSHTHTVSPSFSGSNSTSSTAAAAEWSYEEKGGSGGTPGTHSHVYSTNGSVLAGAVSSSSPATAGTVSTTVNNGTWTASGTVATTLTGVSVVPSYYSLAYIMKL